MTHFLSKKSRLFPMLGILMLVCFLSSLSFAESAQSESQIKLKFNRDKTFKIVQFTDTQDDQYIDPRTVALINAVLEDQKPDLVIFTGDVIKSGPKTRQDVITAINNIVSPVDKREIPWFITYGNHDEEHASITGVDEKGMLDIYMSYPYNINMPSPKRVNGTGNMHVLIFSSKGHEPVFNIWGLDSGRYAPEKIADQIIADDFLLGWTWMPDWDWIRPSQVSWYYNTSEKLEKAYEKKIPSFMFFHIALQEFRTMYENGERHGVVGERNEDECPGPFNSGLYAALLERGDVKGVFVGHDHINDYIGNYFGIVLGYAASAGFGTYGLCSPGPECTEAQRNRVRGARVFILNEDNPGDFETYMVFAKDHGIQ